MSVTSRSRNHYGAEPTVSQRLFFPQSERMQAGGPHRCTKKRNRSWIEECSTMASLHHHDPQASTGFHRSAVEVGPLGYNVTCPPYPLDLHNMTMLGEGSLGSVDVEVRTDSRRHAKFMHARLYWWVDAHACHWPILKKDLALISPTPQQACLLLNKLLSSIHATLCWFGAQWGDIRSINFAFGSPRNNDVVASQSKQMFPMLV